MSHCLLHVGLSPYTWVIYTDLDIEHLQFQHRECNTWYHHSQYTSYTMAVTVKMEASDGSETSALVYQAARHHIPENGT